MSSMQETPPAVAIVGMACRFPGAPSVEQFWRNLREGVESIRRITDDELERAAIDPAELQDPRYVRARGMLDGIDLFDARFFDFSPREAEITDPQQRVLLECAWEAFESAGHDCTRVRGPVGVFAGAGANGYLLYNLASTGHLNGTVNAFQAIVHNKNDHLATRLAYKLDLRGPAITVQTACSTSLVAVILACQSLLSHQCDMALAGGVTITVPQGVGYLYTERGIGSPDGHCRAFDARAQGTVGGSGAGVVILKRLEDAIADGDTIRAVIRGGALNNDGSQKVGYTAPSVDGQAEVIAMAHAIGDVDPDTIGYVEAHGTGTPLGDPIEIRALTQAFRRATRRTSYCAIGAVKTNIGHLDTAAGVAGLIKTVLALEHAAIPPTLHFQTANPEIEFASSPFFVAERLLDWPSAATPRRAGVSSFGLGGTNAHVVLEEAPAVRRDGRQRPHALLVLSAKTDAALEAVTARLLAHLDANPSLDLADVAFTLHAGRRPFAHRRVLVCRDLAEARTLLATLQPERVFTGAQAPSARPVTFMFPGQGSQHAGMARSLYRDEPLFRAEIDRCLAILERHGVSLRASLMPAAGDEAAAAERMRRTELAQPALFVVSYALARLWMSWGVTPKSMIGHSVGEYVAACLAGTFSLEDALALIAARGRLVQALPGGSMLSVPLPEQEIEPLLRGGLALAAVNGPAMCVVSGPTASVEALEADLAGRGLICRRLHTSHAFHSAMMEPALEAFHAAVERTARRAPRVPFLSNVTGTWITNAEACDPAYWVRHLRETVRFGDGLEILLSEPDAVLLEVGPGRTLRTIARWHPRKKPGQVMLASLPHADETQDDWQVLLHAVGHLWMAGVEVDAESFWDGCARRRVPLPTYPFDRQRYWIDMARSGATGTTSARSLAKRPDMADWFYVPAWRQAPMPPVTRGEVPATLVVSNGQALGDQLLSHLGANAVLAHAGKMFRALDRIRYELDPGRPDDWSALFAELQERGAFPRRIVHLGAPGSEGGEETLDDAIEHGLFVPMAIAQALGGRTIEGRVELVLVTNNAEDVVGGDSRRPEQALAVGPALVIPRELPQITCRRIDVSLADPSPAAALAAEVTAGKDELVALRGGRRWIRRFEPLPLPEAAPVRAPLRERGVYLISGGLGGLGYTFAEELARRRARLILVGRSPVPAREEWPATLAAPEDDPVARRVRKVMALEALGAEVLYFAADIADGAAAHDVVQRARSRFGRIDGVIHAAGVPGGGMLQRRTRDAVLAVLRPKLHGARALAAATAGAPLDFFVLCASLVTAVPRFGQIDYTAANAFLDAFAAHESQAGRPTVALDWGAWEEVGMAARSGGGDERAVRLLDHPLLDRCLRDEPGHEVYATDFNVERHWVLDEHRILGNPVVPGVAYFEMVRAALGERAAGRAVRFEEVFFLAPLRVRDGETREARLVLDAAGDSYRFAVRSREGGRLRDFTAGAVRLVPVGAPERHDLDALRRRCGDKELLLPAEEREEDLGPRWHSVRRVHLARTEVLLEMELPDAFSGDFEKMRFHPALLDRAAGIAKNFLAREGSYLPLTYKKLTIHAPLVRRIFSYARFREEESADRETITFDISLLDENGRVLVDIERFTQKRVNDPGSEIRALAAAAREVEEDPAEGRPEEIRPVEGIEALRRVLEHELGPRVVISVRDLDASIAETDRVVRERVLAATAATPQASGRARPRPALKAEYVAPRNEIERRIAEAWQEVLGVERVGVHDNFFDLGGDSVQAIQIIARASHAGLRLNPQQFFQYATIGELAEMLAEILGRQADADAVVGPVSLPPATRDRLDAPSVARRWRALRVELRPCLGTEVVTEALRALATHHDALRVRYRSEAGAWQAFCAPVDAEAPILVEADLGGLDHPTRTTRLVDETAARLRLDQGPTFTATLGRTGGDHADVLVVAAHELVADESSWRILAGDLDSLCRRIGDGDGASLPPRGASWNQWVERVVTEERAAPETADDWSEAVALLEPASGATPGAIRTRSFALSPGQTARFNEVLAAHRVTADEFLATSLLLGLGAATGGRAFLLRISSSARARFPDLDLSRTIGDFTAGRTVLLRRDESDSPASTLQSVKERVRREERPPAAAPRASIELRWSTTGAAMPALPSIAASDGDAHLLRAAVEPLPSCLLVEASVAGDRLEVLWAWDEAACAPPLSDRFFTEHERALTTLIAECSVAEARLSPADFPLADLDEAQLGALADLLDRTDALGE